MTLLARIIFGATLIATTSAAHAVSLSPNGLGQVLIYPYYTVNKDQATLISIVNASDVGKAATVVVMEGYNGRSVLDFNLFLSPHDVWTAAITQSGDESSAAQITTTDTSCTDPQLSGHTQVFRTAGFDGSGGDPPGADAGPHTTARTREGYIAVFARGDIAPGSALDEATTHTQGGTPGGGVPPGCATLNDGMVAESVVAPTNGIYGSGTIIDVGLGTFFGYNADALANYSDLPLFTSAAILFQPFVTANNSEATNGVARSYSSNAEGKPVVADWAYGEDAVSAALMADSIQNEYLVTSTLGANTDWVVTFPTKALYVDSLYADVPRAPFAEAFQAPGVSRVLTVANHYDREEGSSQQPPACDTEPCAAPPLLYLAYEVNVLSYVAGSAESFASGTPSRVLGSMLTYSALDPWGGSGHTRLDLASGDGGHFLGGGVDPDGNDVFVTGLPAVGFMVYNVINTNAQPGLLANYGGAFRHRAVSSCIGAAPCASGAQQ
ncbi:MAG: hypothetical protein ABW186_10450 [Rhodanobacteraceae bacterium]